MEASGRLGEVGLVKGDALVLWDTMKRQYTPWRKKTRCIAPFPHVRKVVTMATHVHMAHKTSQTCLARRAPMQEGDFGVWKHLRLVRDELDCC